MVKFMFGVFVGGFVGAFAVAMVAGGRDVR